MKEPILFKASDSVMKSSEAVLNRKGSGTVVMDKIGVRVVKAMKFLYLKCILFPEDGKCQSKTGSILTENLRIHLLTHF